MQTFLPYPDFERCARVLDRQRLGKQRVECLQILRVLTGKTKGWRNHPAVLMWKGYELHLWRYAMVICREWIRRGYRDGCRCKLIEMFRRTRKHLGVEAPPWLGKRRFHEGHRSNLLRKNPKHYRRFWPKLRADLPYVWPVRKETPCA